MYKKLSAKTQRIVPQIQDVAKEVADTIIITPEDKNQILKKGVLYGIYSINEPNDFNTKVISKIINDVLTDNYYQSENISPVQSLEKALAELKTSLDKMANIEVDMNFICIVLWGNVMYAVQFGKGGIFLIRNSEIKPINTLSEGQYSSASGIIKDDDVVILATEKFLQLYTPEKLLQSPVPSNDLPPTAACLMLKFIVDTSFTESELIEFAEEKDSKTGLLAALSKLNFKDKNLRIKKVPSKNFKFTSKMVMPLILVLLVVSIVITATTKQDKPKIDNVKGTSTDNIAVMETPQEPEVQGDSIAKPETTEDKSVFYDLKITDSNANPTDIIATSNTVYIADTNTGKLYSSDISTPKFTPIEQSFPGIHALASLANNISFNDNEGYKVFDTTTNKATDSYAQTSLGKSANYLGFIYALNDDKITKYTKSTNTLTSSLWTQNAVLTDAKSISVAVSIYVITNNGDVVKFTKGEQDTFKITGLETPLAQPSKILADYDWNNVYICDNGNKRVVVIKDNGTFVKEIKADQGSWDNIVSCNVTPKEDKLIVLNGSKIYLINL